MQKSFFFISVSFYIFATGIFTACSRKTKERIPVEDHHSNIILGFSQIGAESAWRTFNTNSMKDAAVKAGIQLLYANAEQKQENQIKAIRSFIVYQVDVIAFVPIVQEGWDNVLREAKDAQIPVIICDRKIKTADSSLYACYIGTDSLEEGRNAARFLEKKYAGKDGPLNILEIRGTDGSSVSDGRRDGFREIIGKDKRFSIIYSENGDYLRSRGKEIAETILKNNDKKLRINDKPVNIIVSSNDGMMLGFLEVLHNNGIPTGKDITVVSVDAQQEAIDKLRAKEINCVVECNPDLGPKVMEFAKKLVVHETVPRLTHVKERVFTEYDNLDNISPRGY
ncbi:MAG: ABC transporter substrate-binding protein [Treponema sp.]|nr:ABC transporter substrate-binding protein [Treponema sp.]